MTDPEAGRPRPDRHLIAAMGHTVRSRVLAALAHTPPASAADLAKRLDLPPRAVRYHLSELHRAGLIEVAEERARRGVAERFYRRIAVPVIDDDFESLSELERRRINLQTLKLSYADASLALSSGTMTARPDACLILVWADVDSQGWEELVEIQRRAYDELERVKAESAERLRSGAEEPIRTSSTLMCFELPKSD